MRSPGVPLWLKVAYALWMVVWVPVYWVQNGPANFLWLCDVAIIVIAFAVLFESALLFSSQAVSMLVVQTFWVVDLVGRVLLGFHPLGATAYMFDDAKPLWLRLMSFHHVAMLILLVWALRRFGYDRRGFKLQVAILWIVLPLSMLADPERNLNWLWGPFGMTQQTLMPQWLYFLACMAAYPILLYLPTHLALKRLVRPARGTANGVQPPES